MEILEEKVSNFQMSDSTDDIRNQEADESPNDSNSGQGQGGGMQAIVNHVTQDKIEASMWISRLVTIMFTISFVLPLFG